MVTILKIKLQIRQNYVFLVLQLADYVKVLSYVLLANQEDSNMIFAILYVQTALMEIILP
jgi:hypothetical protein